MAVSVLFTLIACTGPGATPPSWSTDAVEVSPVRLGIVGDANDADQQFSGLAWAGRMLVLLPECKAGEQCRVWTVPRTAIERAIDEGAPIEPAPWPLQAPGLVDLDGYDGLEAIAISGEHVWVTAERRPHGGYMVPGRLVGARIELWPALATAIEATSEVTNKSDEAIVVVGHDVWSMHELNGPPIATRAFARRFEDPRSLAPDAPPRPVPGGVVPMPVIPYRVTDATAAHSGRFEVVNYLWSDDVGLRTTRDTVAQAWGVGPSHAGAWKVERILQLSIGPPITMAGPPIYITLDGPSRNWEGIARLDDRGWLVVTDQHPETILAFVPAPSAEGKAATPRAP
ncbi:MAG: hypothetical protein ACI8PZ_002850 [Myxococcota bacterium]|jgi:hypothetical protein